MRFEAGHNHRPKVVFHRHHEDVARLVLGGAGGPARLRQGPATRHRCRNHAGSSGLADARITVQDRRHLAGNVRLPEMGNRLLDHRIGLNEDGLRPGGLGRLPVCTLRCGLFGLEDRINIPLARSRGKPPYSLYRALMSIHVRDTTKGTERIDGFGRGPGGQLRIAEDQIQAVFIVEVGPHDPEAREAVDASGV